MTDQTPIGHLRCFLAVEQAEGTDDDTQLIDGIDLTIGHLRGVLATFDDYRVRLRDTQNDLLDIRGILSPADGPRRVPAGVEMVPAAAPAVLWLADELDRVRSDLVDVQAEADALVNNLAAARAERDQLRRQLEAAEAADPTPVEVWLTDTDRIRIHDTEHGAKAAIISGWVDHNPHPGYAATFTWAPTTDSDEDHCLELIAQGQQTDLCAIRLTVETAAEADAPEPTAPPLSVQLSRLAESWPTPPPPAPHRVTVRTVRVLGPRHTDEWHDEITYDIDHTPQCDALPYMQSCWIDQQEMDAGTDDWPTEPGEYIATGRPEKSFNGEVTEYDFYVDFEPVTAEASPK